MEGTAVLTKLDFDVTAEINNMLSELHLNHTQLEFFAGFISFFSPVLMWDITRSPPSKKKRRASEQGGMLLCSGESVRVQVVAFGY